MKNFCHFSGILAACFTIHKFYTLHFQKKIAMLSICGLLYSSFRTGLLKFSRKYNIRGESWGWHTRF